jgi:hypothetical protein
MSFDTIKAGLVARLNGLGYQESQFLDMEASPSSERGNTFIIRPVSGQNDEDTSETLSSLVYDIEKWIIEIAFDKSSESQLANSDEVQRKREAIIKDLDNPANWGSYARIQKFKTWDVQDKASYFLLTVELKIIDTVFY